MVCSYPYDGGAMGYENGCGPSWCAEPDTIWSCAFPPDMLYRMLEMYYVRHGESSRSYNEVVVDANEIVIEAVIDGRGGAADKHRRILEHFGLNSNQLPLLQFDGRQFE
eukprot:845927-Prymnesium_polylepis.1